MKICLFPKKITKLGFQLPQKIWENPHFGAKESEKKSFLLKSSVAERFFSKVTHKTKTTNNFWLQ